jgi:rubrerythrin
MGPRRKPLRARAGMCQVKYHGPKYACGHCGYMTIHTGPCPMCGKQIRESDAFH